MENTKYRDVKQVVRAQATSDGAGVSLYRSLGTRALPDLDPFLMLDEFKSDKADDYIAGFPPHPHRGFETVTYMLAGAMRHEDNAGNSGNLVSGSVQWMTAARGIIHSEMPQQENGMMWGFQLWVNLPAAEKMKDPHYQDIPPEKIPKLKLDNGVKVRAIAGNLENVEGAVSGISVDPIYLDVSVPENTEWTQAIPEGHNAFAYIFEGQGTLGGSPNASGTLLQEKNLAVLGKGNEIYVKTEDEAVRFILLAGKPIKEPIAKHGPFVMNTQAELYQAFQDYQTGNFAN